MIRAISRAERIFLRVSSGWPQPHKWFLAAAVLSLSLPAVAQVGNSFLRASPPQSPFAGQPGSDAKYVAGEVLVRFRRGAARAAMNSLHAKVGATVIRASRVVEGLQRVRLFDKTKVREAIRIYRQDPNVLYAEPNYIVRALTSPNDPLFSSQWSLQNTGQLGGTPGADIHATQAWNLTTGSASVVVAVIDTGVDYTHPDLAQNIWAATTPFQAFDINGNPLTCPVGSRGFNAVYGLCDPLDDNGHGTHVSGTIGAVGNNGQGVTGINWQVQILPCKFLGSDGSGAVWAAVECLEVVKSLKDSGINIIATNNSWGGNIFSQSLQDAISAQLTDGILFIAAAGNNFTNNDSFPTYPADIALPNVIAVAATDRADSLAAFSNIGSHTVHLAAPGVDILSTTPNNTYSLESGTSMATPHVTGVAALLKAQNPTLDWRAIKNLLLAGGDSLLALSQTITGKRLNAYGSMTCASQPIYARLQPTLSSISGTVGVPITLSTININCSQPTGTVQVSISPGAQTITLLDDGNGSDLAAGDGVYTASWIPPALGNYTLTFPSGDVIQAFVLQNYGFVKQGSSNYVSFTGTNLNLGDDDIAAVSLPFAIPFGGGSFSTLYVSSNGLLSFTNAFGEYVNYSLPLPNGVTPARDLPVLTLLAPFWDDLYPVKGTSQNVFWTVLGTAPNRQLVVEWRDVRYYDCRNDPNATIKFQVVFQEGSGNVLFNYANAVFGGNCSFADAGGSATVGMQVAPGLGTTWSIDQQLVENDTAILWQTPPPTPAPNPIPTLSSLSPSSTTLGGPSFTLTLTGTNFVPGSSILWNNAARAATFVGATQLTADIDAADFNLYDGAGTIPIAVVNPAPGGGTSNALTFTLTAPGPTISALSPASALAGGFGFVLSVSGSNFSPGAQVQWNGQGRQTFVQNPNLLTAQIISSDIATAGSAVVTVVNPAPGGGTSNAVNFPIAARTAGQSSLMMQRGIQPLPGMTNFHSNKPVRFLGWKLASRLGPEYLQYFNRPYANQAIDSANPNAPPTSRGMTSQSTSNPPLPGFAFRDSLPAGFIPAGVATADFNRDGHMDWVVANGGANTLWLYLGKGDGTSQLPTIIPLLGQAPVAVVAADLRGIGISDLIVAEADSGTIGIFFGNGDGTFQREKQFFVPGPPTTLAVADLNKDGHLDIVAGTVASPQVNGFITLLGDGKGNFSAPISAPLDDPFNPPFVIGMAVADFNNDGLPDIVYADPGGDTEAWVFINQGDGTFKRSQLLIFGFPMGDVFIVGTAAGDLNSDGCQDALVLFNFGGAFIYNGDCSGTFKTLNFTTTGLGDAAFNAAVVDVNGDGHPDLVTTGVLIVADAFFGKPAGDLLTVLLNDGTGKLLPPQVYRGDTSVFAFAVADVNGDGKPDIVTANQDSDSATVFLNDGKGGFGAPQGSYVGYLTSGGTGTSNAPWGDFLVSDLNGDGHPDLAFVAQPQNTGAPWRLATLLNDGTGHFAAAQGIDILDFGLIPGDYVLADFRNTGKPDFLEIGSIFSGGSPALIYAKNHGDGTFAPAVVTAAPAAQGIIGVGDFNNDGKLDFVVAGQQPGSLPNSRYQTLTTFLGNGDGTFTQGATVSFYPPPNNGGWPAHLVVGDFNGDGKLDVLVWIFVNVTNNPEPLFELLGNGDGTFQNAKMVVPDIQPFAVADLNHDGQPDIVELQEHVVDWGLAATLVYNIYIAQPDGSFKLSNTYQSYAGSPDPHFFFASSPGNGLHPMIADFNGDGEMDIAAFQTPRAARNSPNTYLQVLLGNGDATFTPSYVAFPLKKLYAPGVAADVNGDGRADLIELDSLDSSYHVIPAVAGPSFQARLVANPVIGGQGILRVTQALASTTTTLQLSASDPAITIPSSVTIPAGQASQDVPFQIGNAFNVNNVFSIQVQSGSEIHSVYGYAGNPALPLGFALYVNLPFAPDTLPGGITPTFTLDLTSIAGYASDLLLSCQGLPAGASCNMGLTSIDLPAGGQSGQFFTVAAPTSLGVGTYPFKVVATDGVFTQSVDTSFSVEDFSLSASMLTLSTLPTATTSFFLSSSTIINNSQPIAITCTTSNPAVQCQLPGPTLSVGLGEQVNVITQNATAGMYTITVTGQVGTLVHSLNIQLTVGNVVASISPTTVTASVGTQSNFTITMTSQGGFTGSFTFSCTNDVGSMFCTANPSPVTLPANGSVSTTLAVSLTSKADIPLPPLSPPSGNSRYSSLRSPVAYAALLALFVLYFFFSPRTSPRAFLPRAAVLCLILVSCLVLSSCGGGSAGGGPGGGGSGGGGGGGGSPTIIHVKVQANSGTLSIPVGTITITVP